MKALLIVDVQNDFCPGDGYPVPDGDRVIKPLNDLIVFARDNKWLVVASKDWHKKELFIGKESKTHCVQNTIGATHHPQLNLDNDTLVITKGSEDLSDKHYSAFKGDEISLDTIFKQKDVNLVYIGGLATEYCVKSTVLDSINFGYKTYLLIDACRGINKKEGDHNKAINEMEKAGAKIINTKDILKSTN